MSPAEAQAQFQFKLFECMKFGQENNISIDWVYMTLMLQATHILNHNLSMATQRNFDGNHDH